VDIPCIIDWRKSISQIAAPCCKAHNPGSEAHSLSNEACNQQISGERKNTPFFFSGVVCFNE
jgi:hypothetical protein